MRKRVSWKSGLLGVVVITAVAGPAFAQTVLYVDQTATGIQTGFSWATAYADLQDALAYAEEHPEVEEIRVAEGEYSPDRDTDDRSATFQLLSGVAIRGGYAGLGHHVPDVRNLMAHRSILSGYLSPPLRSWHVVTGSGVDSTAVLEGFLIVGGDALGSGKDRCGAGMFNVGCSPQVVSCTFALNNANCGGAMYNEDSSPTLISCVFSQNEGGNQYTPGVVYNTHSSPTFTNCTFVSNQPNEVIGCAVYSESSAHPEFRNCVFYGNGRSSPYAPVPEDRHVYSVGMMTVASYCMVQGYTGHWQGVGNSAAPEPDDLFVDLDAAPWGDLQPAIGSPLVNGGDPTVLPASELDADGKPRIQHCRVDIGAFEAHHFVDCNGNSIADDCDIARGTSADCNHNRIPDECDPNNDCNTNGIADICDIGGGAATDHNTNGVPDECDIAAGTSIDLDADGIPDECVIYVDADAPGANDGSNWENAYTELAAALPPPASVAEIRVAAGTYTPAPSDPPAPQPRGTVTPANVAVRTNKNAGPLAASEGAVPDSTPPANATRRSSAIPNDAGTHAVPAVRSLVPSVSATETRTLRTRAGSSASFGMVNGCAIMGGYAGYGAPDPNARDFDLYETTLSGDLYGNDAGTEGREENTLHVVTASTEPTEPVIDATAILNGFTISGGTAIQPEEWGGGLYAEYASPTIRNCTFRDNTAVWDGGGLCAFRGQPALQHCTFTNNHAGHDGGGVCVREGNLIATGCTFIANSADNDGGGLFADAYRNPATATLVNCAFLGNSADGDYGYGGGLWSGAETTLTNCIFSGNTAYSSAGISSFWDSLTVANCTLSGNTATDGGGLYADGFTSVAAIFNSILWDNSDAVGGDEYAQLRAAGGSVAVNHSCIQGLSDYSTNGPGNIDDDPQFVDAAGSDGLTGTEDDDLRLLTGSPAVDAGDNAAVPADVLTDLAGNPRIADGNDDGGPVVDLGPYEIPGDTWMMASTPVKDTTLWRTQGNVMRLTFNAAITAPPSGQLSVHRLQHNGDLAADMSANFSITVENDERGVPRVLRLAETTPCLLHRTWIGVRGGWDGVAEFSADFLVLMGDVDNDGLVKNLDASAVYAHVSALAVSDDSRFDVDGDGVVSEQDALAILPRVSYQPPPEKPSGH